MRPFVRQHFGFHEPIVPNCRGIAFIPTKGEVNAPVRQRDGWAQHQARGTSTLAGAAGGIAEDGTAGGSGAASGAVPGSAGSNGSGGGRNLAKWEAAIAWCSRRNNVEFVVPAEAELFSGGDNI